MHIPLFVVRRWFYLQTILSLYVSVYVLITIPTRIPPPPALSPSIPACTSSYNPLCTFSCTPTSTTSWTPPIHTHTHTHARTLQSFRIHGHDYQELLCSCIVRVFGINWRKHKKEKLHQTENTEAREAKEWWILIVRNRRESAKKRERAVKWDQKDEHMWARVIERENTIVSEERARE